MTELQRHDDAPKPDVYFDISRTDDGRFRVQLVRRGAAPRTSYAARLADVTRQIIRAQRLPVQTEDAEIRQACLHEQIELIAP
jgi:hypothetical protein